MIPKSVKEEAKGSSFSSLQFKTSCLTEKFSKEIELNRRYFIVGERRISSYWWASIFLVGGFGFLITGISSYIKYNLFTNAFRTVESFFLITLDFLKTISSAVFAASSSLPFPSGEEATPSVVQLKEAGGAGTPFFEAIGNGAGQAFGENSSAAIGQNTPSLFSSPFVIDELHSKGGESLVFFPQGLLLCFYGSLAILLSLYWWLLIYWNVGGGFNEFNKREGFMRIFRWGYPGKNRRIDIIYPLNEIEAIRVELNQSPGSGLLTAEQTIFVRLLSSSSVFDKEQEKTEALSFPKGVASSFTFPEGGTEKGKGDVSLLKMARQQGNVEKIKREIPLGGIGQPLTLKEIEKQASELANYLQVALEGL